MASGQPNQEAKGQAWLERLKCAVCLEVFQDPRMLPCHHSFCLHCLQDLASSSSSSFRCPQCRYPVSVTSAGVSQFQRNFYLQPEELEAARKVAEDGNDDPCGIARSSPHQDDLSAGTSTESHRTAESSFSADWLMAFSLRQQEMTNNSSNSMAPHDLYWFEEAYLLPGQLSAETEEEQDEELRRAIQESLQSSQADAPWEQPGQQAGGERRDPGFRNLQKTVASEALQAWNQRRQTGEPSNNQRPRPQQPPADQSNTPAERRQFRQSWGLPEKAEEEEKGGELQRELQKCLHSSQADAPWEQPGQQAGGERRDPGFRNLQKTVASEALQAWNQRGQSGEPSNNQRPRSQQPPADQSNTPAERRQFRQSWGLPEKAEEEEKGGELRRALQKRLHSPQADAPREEAGQQAGQEPRGPGHREQQKTAASETVQEWNQGRQAGESLKIQRPNPPTPAEKEKVPDLRRELEDILSRRESLPPAQRRAHGLLRPGQDQGGHKQDQRKFEPVVPSRLVPRPVREGPGGGQQQQQRTEQDQGSELQQVFKRFQSRR